MPDSEIAEIVGLSWYDGLFDMIIVMQGRFRSTRLPGKGFFTFFGQTIWERMCDIALAVDGVDEVVFATGEGAENELMRPLIEAKGVRFFAGSEENVLERYVRAIENYLGEYVVRLTCDNYLAQPSVIEEAYKLLSDGNFDYVYVEPLSHYAGEIVRCGLLRECLAGNYSDDAKEHVTYDIRRHMTNKVLGLADDFLGLDHSNSPTLDSIEDLAILKTLERRSPNLKDVRCLDAVKNLQDSLSQM